ncbi:UMP kinase [Pseudorhodoplanes sp.]|jgi:uridylate kinase|uniref:UMP kinase n=1 Tax=Pseudorhodoplanes sp. TaxID=1934341 RepID=UPI002B86060F|nr:UMP kinase [Pseudorhodoplanes sp.]HWV42301.1 UMP kinase [Pseudorhodoplanes sp.]
MAKPVYGRVVVKISGEALAGAAGFGVDQRVVETIAADIVASHRLGVEIAVVVGGGNIFRGVEVSNRGVSRPTGDTMGMLATVMNSLVLEAAIARNGSPAATLSAIPMPTVCDTYSRRRALDQIGAGRVVLLAGGTGNPFFTTDTTAVLRASELDCGAVLKATNVDGVYDADPKQNSSAKRYERLSPREALDRNLKVMDSTAFALARENGMPIIVFSIREPGAIEAVLRGEGRSTIVAD